MARKIPSIRSLLRNQCRILSTDDAGTLWFCLRSCHCLLKHFRGAFTEDFLETVLNILPKKMMIQLWESVSPYLIFIPDKARPFDSSPFENQNSPAKILGYFYSHSLKVKTRLSRNLLDMLTEWLAQNPRPATLSRTSFLGRLAQVAALFHLNDTESDILGLIYLKRTNSRFDNLFDYGVTRNQKINDTIISWFLPYPWGLVAQGISENGILRRMQLITNELEISSEIAAFLSRLSDEPLNSGYFSRVKIEPLPLEKSQVPPKEVEIIKALLTNREGGKGVNLLLAGPPGTGKSEFSRSLGKALKMNVFESIILGGNDRDQNVNFRFRSIVAFQNMCGSDRQAMLIIDESDALLNNGRGFFFSSFGDVQGKAIVNQCLDDAKNVQIWITNRDEGLDESTCRRFDYVVRFKKPGLTQRRKFWETIRERHQLENILLDRDIDKLASEFHAGAGGIDVALRNVKYLAQEGWDRPSILGLVESLLTSHQKTMGIKKAPAVNSQEVRPGQASMDQLSLKNPDQFLRLQEVLTHLQNHKNEECGTNTKLPRFRILLQGKPGTGKTFFARHVAEKLDVPLIIKTAADILDPYVGMCERHIREAFEEAESEGAVLFFDEIDGLMQSRGRAFRSWEVTRVNELLTCMENFPGIFIAATNCYDLLDPASIRRFSFKIEFDYLKPQANISFYKSILANLLAEPIPDSLAVEISQIRGLAPGDFAAVRQRFSPLHAGTFRHEDLVKGLIEETAARSPLRNGIIGFKHGQ
ncbi:MAG: AAA family ATPase [Candidatus Riflebacteria bacterium]|nr:AAA family ATPase [Candidatus Riflebacteria bacterium]